jgi:hypothetical protein
LGAGGATQFSFNGRQPFGWRMTIQGSRERILDSVLPHEITHTIFATHFGQALPRWADEGACTMVEHAVERSKQEHLLIQFLTSGKGIAFNQMFAMMDYPPDMLPLYSQGYALAQFFIAQGGKQKYVKYVGEGMATNNWTATTRKYYGYESLSDLQVTWVEWIRNGRQVPIPASFAKAPEMQLAAATRDQVAAASHESDALQDWQQASSSRHDAASGARDVQTAPLAVDQGHDNGRARLDAPHGSNANSPPLSALAAAEGSSDISERYAPGSTARVGLIERTATRPQSLGQTQQQVLQWEHSPATPGAIYR